MKSMWVGIKNMWKTIMWMLLFLLLLCLIGAFFGGYYSF